MWSPSLGHRNGFLVAGSRQPRSMEGGSLRGSSLLPHPPHTTVQTPASHYSSSDRAGPALVTSSVRQGTAQIHEWATQVRIHLTQLRPVSPSILPRSPPTAALHLQSPHPRISTSHPWAWLGQLRRGRGLGWRPFGPSLTGAQLCVPTPAMCARHPARE